ncbi:hypothetical protein CDAR_378141 [Caerostris darwini]|uniref:Uncharacterized protein n=1 Tax=Caerostris darwini TaxID=1538125 RepID=A0AAV4UIU9_9ARAC|nr:hypothetical protein CDAR_378141 [Caerostris darwini]
MSEEAILVRVNDCGFPTPEVVFLWDSFRYPTPERCFYGGEGKRFDASNMSEDAIFVPLITAVFRLQKSCFSGTSLRPPTPERCFYGGKVT